MDEYIERSALDKALTIAAANGKDKDRRTWAKAICVLHDAPAADVAPVVHGRWEWDTSDIYRCTVCNRKAHVKETMYQPAWQYCPNCGAKMDTGDDNG